MKKALCAALLVLLIVFPGMGLTEGNDTIQLARTLYTLGRDETYETKLMIGSVIMNRVESPWYPNTLKEVLEEPHQFPHGALYDEEALQAAREMMMGRRVLPHDITVLCALDATVLPDDDGLYTTSGNYSFYYGK